MRWIRARTDFWDSHTFIQIWATIIRYYTGSIADGADWRNLRKLHFQLIIFWGAKSVKSTHASTVNSTLNFWRSFDELLTSIWQSLDVWIFLWIFETNLELNFNPFFFVKMSIFDESTFHLKKFTSCFKWIGLLIFKLLFFDDFMKKIVRYERFSSIID